MALELDLNDLKICQTALAGLHRAVAVPTDVMPQVVSTKRKVDILVQLGAEAEAGNGDVEAKPKLVAHEAGGAEGDGP